MSPENPSFKYSSEEFQDLETHLGTHLSNHPENPVNPENLAGSQNYFPQLVEDGRKP